LQSGIRPVNEPAVVRALDIMRSAGAEPIVGQTSRATNVIGFAAPRTDPLNMTAI